MSTWIPCPYCFQPAEVGAATCPRCGTRLADDEAETRRRRDDESTEVFTGTAPARVDRFRLVREVGRGAFGAVWLATDESTGTPVALKVLPPLMTIDARERERTVKYLRREADALTALEHEGIVKLIDVGEHAGNPYLAMEFVEGRTLAQRIEEGRPSPEEAARIVREVLAAIGHAHGAGVIHRDLKPANIMIAEDGSVKVTDFGLAKIHRSLADSVGSREGILGTPHYMSPEQASGRTINARSDLFSLGAIAYELFTGQRPFPGPLTTAIYKILHEEPARPSSLDAGLSPAIDSFLQRALEKNSHLRFADAAEMARSLDAAMGSLPLKSTAEVRVQPAPSDHGIAPTAEIDARKIVRAQRIEQIKRRAAPRSLERYAPWIGVFLVILLGIGAAAMYALRATSPAPRVPASPTLEVLGPPEATTFVDGRRMGTLPGSFALPEPGPHLLTVIVPKRRPLRRLLQVKEGERLLTVRTSFVDGSDAAPEELTALGVVLQGAAPLAFVLEPTRQRRWVASGETVGDGRLVAVEEGGLQFEVPLSLPDLGSATLRLPLAEPESEGSSRRILVQSHPPGAQVRLEEKGPMAGLTPCAVELPRGDVASLYLRGPDGQELVLRDMSARRLLFMGELAVVMARRSP